MKMSRWILVVCLVTWLITQVDLTSSQETTRTVEAFTAKIKDIINDNGLGKFLESLRGRPWVQFRELSGYFGNGSGDGETDFDRLLGQLQKYFSGIKSRQETLLRDEFLGQDDFPPRCGPDLNLSSDADLQIEVSRSTPCFLHPNPVQSPPDEGQKLLLKWASSGLLREANSVGERRHVSAFIALDGSTLLYPGLNVLANDLVMSQRHWLDGFLSPIPKDIVLILDTSSLMSRTLKNKTDCGENCQAIVLLRDAVDSLINSLSTKDRLAVVVTNPQSLRHSRREWPCAKSEMAYATKESKNYFVEFMGGIHPTGIGFNISEVFQRAFKYFRSDNNPPVSSHGRERILIPVIGSRQIKDEEYYNAALQTVRTENKAVNDTVIVMGMYIQTDQEVNLASVNTEKLLADMTHSQLRGGKYTLLDYGVDVRKWLHTMFDKGTQHFTIASHFPILGPTIQSCSSVHKKQENNRRRFVGLLCSIRPTQDLESLIQGIIPEYMKSYAFILDGTGRLVLHPTIRPAQNPDEFIHFETLEKFPEARNLLKRIVRGETVHIRVERLFSTPRIHDIIKGEHNISKMANYTCASISDTDLSVCTVSLDGDSIAQIKGTERYPGSFLYHNLNLLPDEDKPAGGTCLHYDQMVYPKRASFMLTRKAFRKPSLYKGMHQTKSDVSDIIKFMVNRIGDIGVKDGVREMVSVISLLTTQWSNNIFNGQTFYGKWLYAGFNDGLFVCYPGPQNEYDYEHTERPWYKLAVAMPNRIVLTRPYRDYAANGTDYVISICKAIVVPTYIRFPANFTIGVMCVDHTLSHFNFMVNNTMKDLCPSNQNITRCIFIDDSGYIIDHATFHNPDEDVLDVHIIHKEWTIAELLWKKEILKKKYCTSLPSRSEEPFWEVALNGQKYVKFTENGTIYEMKNTNIFLIVVDDRLLFPGYKRSEHCVPQHCSPGKLENCSCSRAFDDCDNTFNGTKSQFTGSKYTLKDFPLCPSPVYDPDTDVDLVKYKGSSLEKCIVPVCNLDFRRCEDFQCKACKEDTPDGPITRCTRKKTCDTSEENPIIISKTTTPVAATTPSPPSTMTLLTILLIVAMGLLFVVILTLVVLKCTRKTNRNPILRDPSSSASPIPVDQWTVPTVDVYDWNIDDLSQITEPPAVDTEPERGPQGTVVHTANL